MYRLKREHWICTLKCEACPEVLKCYLVKEAVAVCAFFFSKDVVTSSLFQLHPLLALWGSSIHLLILCQKIIENLFRHCLNLVLLPQVRYFSSKPQ